MNAAAAPKSPAINKLEGTTLTALFLGLPTFAAAVLMLKLAGDHQVTGNSGGAAIFVTLTTLCYAMTAPYLGRKYPKIVKYGYEPVFFDPALSFGEKIARWRTQPVASLQLVTTVLMLSMLAVAEASVG
jgi:hypothetical protein